MNYRLAMAVALALGCGSACALPFIPDVAVGAEAGTLGVGGEVTTNILPLINARVTVQGLDYSYGYKKDGTDYDGKLKLLTYGALLDLYPLHWGPRISAGLYGNNNKLDLNANCANQCNEGDATITGGGEVGGNMKFKSVAPYAGIGWSNPMTSIPFYFGFDLGVLFQGSPKVGLHASGTGTVSENGVARPGVNLATDPQVQSALADEQSRLSEQTHVFRYYPVARLMIGWRF